MKIRTYFRWYDLWIGAYWDRKQRRLYVCLLPTWVIEIDARNPTMDELERLQLDNAISERLGEDMSSRLETENARLCDLLCPVWERWQAAPLKEHVVDDAARRGAVLTARELRAIAEQFTIVATLREGGENE